MIWHPYSPIGSAYISEDTRIIKLRFIEGHFMLGANPIYCDWFCLYILVYFLGTCWFRFHFILFNTWICNANSSYEHSPSLALSWFRSPNNQSASIASVEGVRDSSFPWMNWINLGGEFGFRLQQAQMLWVIQAWTWYGHQRDRYSTVDR